MTLIFVPSIGTLYAWYSVCPMCGVGLGVGVAWWTPFSWRLHILATAARWVGGRSGLHNPTGGYPLGRVGGGSVCVCGAQRHSVSMCMCVCRPGGPRLPSPRQGRPRRPRPCPPRRSAGGTWHPSPISQTQRVREGESESVRQKERGRERE